MSPAPLSNLQYRFEPATFVAQAGERVFDARHLDLQIVGARRPVDPFLVSTAYGDALADAVYGPLAVGERR